MTGPGDANRPDGPSEDPRDPLGPLESATDPGPGSPNGGASSSEPFDPVALDPGALGGVILSYNSAPDASPSGYQQFPASEPQFSGGPSNRFLDPDLRVPWGWIDVLLLVIVYIGANVLSVIFLAIVFASHGIPFTTIQHSSREMGFFVLANELIVYVALFSYLWVHVRSRSHTPFWSTLGWRRLDVGKWPRPRAYLGLVALGLFLSASVELVSTAFPPKGTLPIQALLQNHQAALALMAMSVILAPVVEETIFRGYLYPVAARSFGTAAGIILTGTVFGLLHAEQLWGGWAQIALLVVVGIVFTWVRAAKRTVLASYLLHVSYNFLIVLGGLHSLHP